MNELGKRLLFRLVRIFLIAVSLMAGLVWLHPELLQAMDAQPPDQLGGAQGGLLLALLLAAVCIRVWLGIRRRKRSPK